MARINKIRIPVIALASCSTLVLGLAQFAASPLPCEGRPLTAAAAVAATPDTPPGNAAAVPATTAGGTTAPATNSKGTNGAASAGDSKTAAGATAAGASDTPAAQVTELKQEQIQLRRMGEAIKRTRRAGLDIIGECTQPIEMMGEIDIIGQDVIPIMPATSEGFGNNYMPPRPKYVRLHMTQLASMIPILQDDIDNLTVPDSEKTYATQPVADLKGYMDDLRKHFKKLKSLTRADDYDQVALTTEARQIDGCCKSIDAARKQLLHEEGKIERKEEKLERSEEKK